MNYLTTEQALKQLLSADIGYYVGEPEQALAELLSVVGFGVRDTPEEGNSDEGPYVAICLYPHPHLGRYEPVIVHVLFDGPAGSVSMVLAHPLGFSDLVPPTADELVVNARWAVPATK